MHTSSGKGSASAAAATKALDDLPEMPPCDFVPDKYEVGPGWVRLGTLPKDVKIGDLLKTVRLFHVLVTTRTNSLAPIPPMIY